MSGRTILIIDDDELIRELLCYNLEKEGYRVIAAKDGAQALDLLTREQPDLIILDLMLPGIDGLEVCRQIRFNTRFLEVPLIMLTAKGEEIDKVLGLELGADDYVTKPFNTRELLARIKARLRRVYDADKSSEISDGEIRLDIKNLQVYIRGEEIVLTPKEFELLRILVEHPGKAFSRDELLEQIWGYDYFGDSRTVDVHVRHLRQKIERDPSKPDYIETIRGLGYRYKGKRNEI
ncbi:MAG TPA: response regulator transcription factor [Desulfitobacteriaceae bacterium]|nr:response regulator transcription factor [Desulfitobacteriaceae bacterium]